MSKQTLSEEVDTAEKAPPSKRHWFWGHEFQFLLAFASGALVSGLFSKHFVTIDQGASVELHPHRFPGYLLVLITLYAIYRYWMYLRTEMTIAIPFFEKLSLFGIFALIVMSSHFLGATTSIDANRLKVYEPLTALLGAQTEYPFDRCEKLATGINKRGNQELLYYEKGAAHPKGISASNAIQRILPRIIAAAKGKGVKVDKSLP